MLFESTFYFSARDQQFDCRLPEMRSTHRKKTRNILIIKIFYWMLLCVNVVLNDKKYLKCYCWLYAHWKDAHVHTNMYARVMKTLAGNKLNAGLSQIWHRGYTRAHACALRLTQRPSQAVWELTRVESTYQCRQKSMQLYFCPLIGCLSCQ